MDLRDRTATEGIGTEGIGTEERITDDDLLTFRLMHRGMRADSAALVDALLRLPPGDLRAAHRLRTWFAALEDLIEHHHSVEDEVFWPALRAADPSFGPDEAVLVADHHEQRHVFAAFAQRWHA